jgi:hypothetical protein
MNQRKHSECLLIAIALYALAGHGTASVHALPYWAPQKAKAEPDNPQFDPMKYVTNSFTGSVALKRKGHLLEFCPDNTCDGFVSSANVPVTQLKDFAYLYIYFFSDFIYLPDWRSHAEAKDAAERVLSKRAYGNCKAETDLQSGTLRLARSQSRRENQADFCSLRRESTQHRA